MASKKKYPAITWVTADKKTKSPKIREDFTLDQMEYHSEQIKAGKKQDKS